MSKHKIFLPPSTGEAWQVTKIASVIAARSVSREAVRRDSTGMSGIHSSNHSTEARIRTQVFTMNVSHQNVIVNHRMLSKSTFKPQLH